MSWSRNLHDIFYFLEEMMRLENLKRTVPKNMKEQYLLLLYVLSIINQAVMEAEHCIRKTDFRGYLHWSKKTTAIPKYETTEQLVAAIAELEKVYEDLSGITQSLALEIVKHNDLYGENMNTIIKALVACYNQTKVYTLMKTGNSMYTYDYWKSEYEKIEEKIFNFPELHVPTAFEKEHMDLYLDIDIIEPWNGMGIYEAEEILVDAQERAEVAFAFLLTEECQPEVLIENTKKYLKLFMDAVYKYKNELRSAHEKKTDN